MDTETNKTIQLLIRHEFKEYTGLSVEHTLDNILDYDKVAVFDSGYLVEFDKPDVLMGKESNFRALYHS